jgi:VWFA-related protein
VRTVIACVVILCVAYGQDAPKPGDAVFRVTSTLVQIDAVVTDAKGRQVTNLTSDDFEILADRKPQQITHFSYVRVAGPGRIAEQQADPIATGSFPPAPAKRMRPEDVRRTMILMVDDLGLSFESMAFLRRALRKFVDEQMQPGDLVAVCRTGAGSGNLQQFTPDKRLLKLVIDNLRWNPNGRAGLSVFAPIGQNGLLAQHIEAKGSVGPAARTEEPGFHNSDSIDSLRQTMFTTGTLGSIDYVIGALREMPGRKSLVLFSDGLVLNGTGNGGNAVREALRKLIDRANRAGAVIYTMDSRGLDPLQIGAQDRVDLTGMNPQQTQQTLAQLRSDREDEFYSQQQGLAYLALKTGGVAYENGNDLNWGMGRVLEDQQGYYLLGFAPPAGTFDDKGGSRPFHSIVVNVKGKGLRVRSRSGFFGATDEETRPKYLTPIDEMRVAMLSPFHKAEIRVRLTALYAEAPKQGPVVRNLVHVDARDLKLEMKANGSGTAKLDVLAAAYGAGDRPLELAANSKEIVIEAADLARVLEDGFVYTLDVPVKKPGAYQIRLAVRDDATGKVGAAYQYLDIPNAKKPRMALTSIILENGAPSLAELGSLGITAARRQFPRGGELEYMSLVENGSASMNARVRVVRDGKEVYSAPVKLTPVEKEWAILGKLKLAVAMTPGEYFLQVSAEDPGRSAAAWQWTDFEVMP